MKMQLPLCACTAVLLGLGGPAVANVAVEAFSLSVDTWYGDVVTDTGGGADMPLSHVQHTVNYTTEISDAVYAFSTPYGAGSFRGDFYQQLNGEWYTSTLASGSVSFALDLDMDFSLDVLWDRTNGRSSALKCDLRDLTSDEWVFRVALSQGSQEIQDATHQDSRSGLLSGGHEYELTWSYSLYSGNGVGTGYMDLALVPEPTSLGLLCLGGVTLLRCRR